MPVIQLIILPWAADYEVKNIKLAVVDQDHSEYSRQLINKITSSGYFNLSEYAASYSQALQQVEKDEADLVLQIPNRFEKQLVKENEATLFVAINAINGVKASLGGSYLRTIIQDYNKNRSIMTSIIEWMEGGDYFNFIQHAQNEMEEVFQTVEIVDVGIRAAWYICTPKQRQSKINAIE